MRFTKMQGAGNDYVYLDCTREEPRDLPALAVRLARPHFGVGSDGLICICPSDRADFRMRMFNADGSESEMCGNGLRCVCKFVYDKGLTRKTRLEIETLAGVRGADLHLAGGRVRAVTVDMGEPWPEEARALLVGGREYLVTPVSVGNPHIVLFVDAIHGLDLESLGPGFEHHPAFAPRRTNVEFVEAVDPSHLRARVWERGSGETLACGSGACAVAVAAVLTGRGGRQVKVTLPGGTLEIDWDRRDGHVYMTGDAVTVFEGEMNL